MTNKRSFMATIADLREGRTQDDLTQQLSELNQAVMATGRAGKLTLTLEIKPAAKDSRIMLVSDTIVLKAPKEDRPGTLMFSGAEGSLQLDDPNAEPRGNMRDVSRETPALREVNHG